MGIFSNGNQSHQNTRSDSSTTIITAGTEIRGDIKLSCNLYIDGYFEGNIVSEQEINIGKEGKIKGEIVALRVIVQGLAEGSINANRVDIKPDGKVTGSVISEEFVIEAKGIFEGNSLVKRPEEDTIKNNTSKIKKEEKEKDTSDTQIDKVL
ncbi:polymer-forming cytoskeletal protein [Arcobacter lanthieri]|uniref:bactofilin family protein n=1 Tax=Aliarcobacter lanthieri TaxID=1355374 RepID=UPI0019237BE4|nr:polymer-forming cytoskeletal protein [Aliarcobacter lanthieri]MBL3520974.1 polymer-forming cytoskeletal protein [Aliarcobacter lanthieri]